MPEQSFRFRTPPGFYNEYHDMNEIRRRQNTTNNTTVRPGSPRPITNDTSRLFSAPTPTHTRRQPGGKRKSRRKSTKRRKMLKRRK